MNFKDRIKLILSFPINKFCQLAYKKPSVMSDTQTLNYVLDNECSVARFGDGEFDLMCGIGIKFQKADKTLKRRLNQIAKFCRKNYNDGCLICLPNVFSQKKNREVFVKTSYGWWKRFLTFTKGLWYKKFSSKSFIYGDTNISRFYMEVNDKKRTYEYVNQLKKIWDEKNIVFVEGIKSRLGEGNDLFDNAASVKRILCPSANAFEKYDTILSRVMALTTKTDLIICALGPTATVLCYDLYLNGRRAIDLGHIDVEYEWFRMGATEKVRVLGKDVSETKNELKDGVFNSEEDVLEVI